ncbi:metallophosphoesterase [Gemmobacter denitrificans]|uniref:Metallophosphoesterase n=1 Tax=Gemmobacter denitrificans TaxID=3123040 RepID=A0ABU8BZQ0_9RHOB
MRAYAIGDIHGHLDLLRRAHDRIAADIARHGPAPVIHLGDLVDRGPDSQGVIRFLMEAEAHGADWITLKGNHDDLFTRFLRDPAAPTPGLRADLSWLHPKIGGAATLASFGVRAAGDRPVAPVHAEAQAAVPPDMIDWLEARPTQHWLGDCVYVHAGFRPGIPFHRQTETDLIWIREPFLSDNRDHGALVIHGHTALDSATHYGNRVNIDSSAAYGGPLTAIAVEGQDIFVLTDQGREPLRPA